MEINFEKEYPSEFESEIKFVVKFSNEKGGGVSCYIPTTDTFFSAPDMEVAKKRASVMVKSFIQFWNEENNKGVLNK